MVVPYTVEENSFRAGKVRFWSQQRLVAPANAALALQPNADRFATITNVRDSEARQDNVVFILSFFDYLRQIAPAQGTR